MAIGNGTSPNLNSLHSLVDSSQYTAASAGQAISLELLDALMDLVKAKDGEVDFIMMPSRTIRSYKALVRALGGVNETMVFTMPNGTTRNVSTYEGIPIFKNDYLSIAETANGAAISGGALTSVYAGCWDDGSNKVGIAMIHPIAVPAGIAVEMVGTAEAKDEQIVRVKSYSNFAQFNRRGTARLTSINNQVLVTKKTGVKSLVFYLSIGVFMKDEKKLVDVAFDIKALDLNENSEYCYGVAVEKKGSKMVGQCSPEELKCFQDGGRADFIWGDKPSKKTKPAK